jgi:glycine dehydrogenase subunit 1
VAASVLKSAGSWGADIYVGEGQPFGMALSFGGPFLGLFACNEEQIRRLPGRIVGETVDSNGRRAFVTTLRAREQDIRREKATSNICSNQTLMAVTAAIQLGYLGTYGLAEVATRCAQGAHYLFDELTTIAGVTALNGQPFFREFALRLPVAADGVLSALADEGILGGVAVRSLVGDVDPSIAGDTSNIVLIAVTERRTRDELDRYASVLRKVLS